MQKKAKLESISENNLNGVEKIKVKPKEPLAEIIGDIGKWQAQRIAIVFFIGIPGIAHVFSAAFIAAKTDYWCSDQLSDDLLNYTIESLPKGIPSSKNVSLLCASDCKEYGFDHSFWKSTLISQFGLVCEKSYLSGETIVTIMYTIRNSC